MNLTVHISDELATRLGESLSDLERQALEAFVLENFRAGRMTISDLGASLGFEALDQVDAFLKAHRVYAPFTIEEVNQDVELLAKLGY